MTQMVTPRLQTPQTPRPVTSPRVHFQAGTPRDILTPTDKPPDKPAEHAPPVFDIPWKNGVSNGNSMKLDDHDQEASSLLPLLISNFSKLHASSSQILAKLQAFEDSHPTAAWPRPSREISGSNLLPPKFGGNHHIHSHSRSVESSFSGNAFGAKRENSGGNISALSGPSVCSSPVKVAMSLNIHEKLVTVRSRLSQVSSTALSHLTLDMSTREDVDKIAEIIRRHSNHLQRKGGRKQRVWEFLENRHSSKLAFLYGSYIAPLLLLLSLFTSFIQTVEEWSLPDDTFFAIQTGFESWFALEIIVRFVVCPDRLQFWSFAFNWIDAVSIAPLFFRIIVRVQNVQSEFLHRVLALVPMIRLLKMLRRFYKFQLMISAFSIAVEALPVLIFSLMLIAIMFSGLMYLVESRDLIEDMPRSLWFVIVTMSTVGYGDIVPETRVGQAISGFLMVMSALYMALPIGIVGNAFNEVWKDRDRLLLIEVLRENLAICGISRNLVLDVFTHFNMGTGSAETNEFGEAEIGVQEFQKMISALQINVSEERAVALFSALDEDGNGRISCDEFLHKLFPVHFLKRRFETLSTHHSTFETGTTSSA